jgi:hypothetical protein
MLAGLFWLLYRLGGVFEARLSSLGARTDSTGDRVLYPLAGRTVRLARPLVALILGTPALASAPDASSGWDLRCEIREKLVEFIQRNYPGSLPRMRAARQPPVQEVMSPAPVATG